MKTFWLHDHLLEPWAWIAIIGKRPGCSCVLMDQRFAPLPIFLGGIVSSHKIL
jgi:hypothetical protein